MAIRNLSELPRVPEEALKILVGDFVQLLPISNDATYSQLSKRHATDVWLLQRAAIAAARRCRNKDIRALALEVLDPDGNRPCNLIRGDVGELFELFAVIEFEDHFFDDTDTLDFDEVELPDEVVLQIEERVAEARELTQKADCFGEKQRRSILHSLAKVENELRKEKTNLEAVYEIAYKGADIVERYGEAVRPLANAISAIRSKTILNSEGQKAIEAEEKPKQIEDKSKQ